MEKFGPLGPTTMIPNPDQNFVASRFGLTIDDINCKKKERLIQGEISIPGDSTEEINIIVTECTSLWL